MRNYVLGLIICLALAFAVSSAYADNITSFTTEGVGGADEYFAIASQWGTLYAAGTTGDFSSAIVRKFTGSIDTGTWSNVGNVSDIMTGVRGLYDDTGTLYASGQDEAGCCAFAKYSSGTWTDMTCPSTDTSWGCGSYVGNSFTKIFSKIWATTVNSTCAQLWSYEGGTSWSGGCLPTVDDYTLTDATTIISYGGELYVGGTTGTYGMIVKCTSNTVCSMVKLFDTVSDSSVLVMRAAGGNLYAGLGGSSGNSFKGVWKFDGSTWTDTGLSLSKTEINGLAGVGNSMFFMGNGKSAAVLREYNGSSWINKDSVVSGYKYPLTYQDGMATNWNDSYNNRLVFVEGTGYVHNLQGFVGGNKISSPPSGASVVYSTNSIDANKKYSSGSQTLRTTVDGTYAGEFTYDFDSGNLDLSSATVDADATAGKAVMHNMPGSVTNKWVLVPKTTGSPYHCPNATSLTDVAIDCLNVDTNPSVTEVSIGGNTYYKMANQGGGNGGGGGSSVPELSDYAIFGILILVSMALFTSKKYI